MPPPLFRIYQSQHRGTAAKLLEALPVSYDVMLADVGEQASAMRLGLIDRQATILRILEFGGIHPRKWNL